MQKFQLTGSAVHGIESRLMAPAVLAALPTEVCLGANLQPQMPRMAVRMEDFFAPSTPPPATTNWRQKAASVIAEMYLNNQLGDCVIASIFKLLGVWSANDPDSDGVVLASDSEAQDQYFRICGPGDNGCIISYVLEYARSHGMVLGGKPYKLDGYCSGDHTSQLLVQAVTNVFGPTKIGFSLPQAWLNSDTWDIVNSPIVGGHDVLLVDYDPQGLIVASWGRLYRWTWRAFLTTRYVSEWWVALGPLWYGKDGLAASGFDTEGLRKALNVVNSGGIPGWEPPPAPPVPPKPPVPPVPQPPRPPVLTIRQQIDLLFNLLEQHFASRPFIATAIHTVHALLLAYLDTVPAIESMTLRQAVDALFGVVIARVDNFYTKMLLQFVQALVDAFLEHPPAALTP